MVHGIALQATDIDGIVHHIPAAAGLAGMLADIGAGRGEGIVLADEPHGVRKAARLDQGNITRDVHPGGTHGYTGHRVSQRTEAAVVEDMLLKILPKAPDTGENQVCGVNADGTVRRVHNDLCGLLQMPQHPQIGVSVQNLREHIGQLGQSDAAGNAFAAGLRPAQVQ